MKKKSILIVFSEKRLAEITSKKINLLRSDDKITFVSYDDVNNVGNKISPSIVIVCHSNIKSLSIIDEIKKIFIAEKPPIILVTEKTSEDIFIDAYEKEIDDFFSINDSEPIILMRILNAIKKGKIQKNINIKNEILISQNFLDANNEIFKKDYASNILTNHFNKITDEQIENSVFLHLTMQKEENSNINLVEIGSILKNTIRETDIITYGNNNSFNIILENIDEEQTINLVNKINKNLEHKYLIYYTAIKITKNYNETINALTSLINMQITDKEYFIFINDIEEMELSAIIQTQKQKENISKIEFIKNIENIIAPVFYQMQTKYSERLNYAEINYYINNSANKFTIKKDEITNELSITYPTIENIIIDVNQFLNNNIVKERKITYHTEDFTEDKLVEEIEKMIKDFIEADSINTINKETYETK